MKWILIVLLLIIILIATTVFVEYKLKQKNSAHQNSLAIKELNVWSAPDSSKTPNTEVGSLIKYGRSLVVNTSVYFGPRGIIARKSNGMNCQNCHADAGTRMFGNNFALVAGGYPRYKDRSGSIETIEKKVQDCFERSLNGDTISSSSKEMKAFIAYLNWVGSDVSKKSKPPGAGIEELPFLARAADTLKGKLVYINKCQKCHGKNGEGLLLPEGNYYEYPPLWGNNSYNIGASIYRVSKFAGYVKNNMPFGATYLKPQLSNEEAWDVAAYVNSQPHPYKNLDADWPKISAKPYDYPFGPFAENQFSLNEHKYGPFAPIKNYYLNLNKKN
ncbi:MAG: c-type cytochrome [Bacteroidota bacterium]|nr:c-type cytochrome [Bacteroidota bacterium]